MSSLLGTNNRIGKTVKFDAISLEIVWGRLIAILDEAAAKLYHSAFSTVVRESNDASCVLTDSQGRSLAQTSVSIPSFIGTLPLTVQHMRRLYPAEKLSPGDVLICNDPWLGTGHLNDINIVMPIFLDGQIIAYAASTAHAPDIGGRLLAPDSRELFEEGLRIPPLKLHEAGEPNATILQFIKDNVRVPREVVGDLEAQVAANRLTENRLLQLLAEYNIVDVEDLALAIHAQSEQAMRMAIKELPSGDFHHQLHIRDFPENVDLRITVKVDSDSGTIVCDYAGSAAQQYLRAWNVVPAYTFAYTAYSIKCIVAPYVPNNEGCFRPIEVRAPEGSIFNPRYPAGVGARHWIGHHIPTLVNYALAQAVPEKVKAESLQPHWIVVLSGERDTGENFVEMFFQSGGMGAGRGQDGLSCVGFPSNSANSPIEMLEQACPITVLQRSMWPDSAGPGQWRGGMGQIIEFVVEAAQPVAMTLWPSHMKDGPAGLVGGSAATVGIALVNDKPLDYTKQVLLYRGDRVALFLPGGGGYGSVALREAAETQADIDNDYTSIGSDRGGA